MSVTVTGDPLNRMLVNETGEPIVRVISTLNENGRIEQRIVFDAESLAEIEAALNITETFRRMEVCRRQPR